MPKHRVIGGRIVTTPEEVFAHYRPRPHLVDPAVWTKVRPSAVEATRAADYVSVASALNAMSAVTHFLVWTHGQGLGLELEKCFLPEHVEHYCASTMQSLSPESRSTRRGYLRRVGRACTKDAPWPAEPKPFSGNNTILPPYTPEEVEGFWKAAEAQSTPLRTRVALAMLTLGLGAGVQPGEMLRVTADHVSIHPDDHRLMVIRLESRTTPVLAKYTNRLRDLCSRYPEEPLVGKHRPTAKDPLGTLRQDVAWPGWLPRFRVSRLRTTWMADVLTLDLRISEFMVIAGNVSSKSLEVIAPDVPGRWEGDAYLFKGAGL
ncbi:hypothetical protein [Serinicoccus chungangensis]|uniref:hypothetical protein n=1 Tax=Serinicoccus chungangensis TaxID=767452 RepID=UPI00128FA4DC|nr:hypothetical protein [Serinicoccus chungangensis]